MASTYTMVAYGSQGSAVRQLQNELNKRGYSLDQDGIFGKKTRAAVRDYQKKNGLTMVDGIAGDETWGSLLSAPTAAEQAAQAAAAAEAAAPRAEVTAGTARRLQELERGYTPSDEVTAAQAYRDSVAALEPEAYRSRFEERLQALYDQIAGREAFDYDPEEDESYQRYARLYAARGAAAMEDTLGKAAALTGGYASSYAQSAGQQAYNAYLQKLNEVVPELYAQARSQYDREGSALSERYARISSREKSDYDRYRDQVSDYYAALSDARGAYQSEAQRSENLALQYAKLANDNYWNELNYRSDREDAANAQYWKQLAYADKQAAAAEKAAQARQKAAQAGTAKDKQTKRSSSLARGRGEKRGRTAPGTARRDEIN